VHRALQLGAGLTLAFAILTCTNERVTGPTRPGALLLDVHALVASSPGQPVIPLDSLRITLRRPTETTYAYDKTILVRSDTVKGDSVVLRLDVQLQQSAEDFILDVTAFGAGIAWYSLTASVHLTAGATAAPTPFLARYIGPGHNAKLVRVFPVDTTAIGGTSFPLRSVVTDSSDGVITGVPVGYRLSDATHGSVTTGYLSASFTAAPTVRDSVWVFAETPTHLKDSTRIHILPPAASLQKVSGDAQTAVLGAPLKNPLVVRVLDALNGGFKGDTVRWTVTTANATLTAPFSVSDDTGYALVSLTPSALGSVTVQAAVTGLSGSPQTFTVTSTAGTVRQVIISPKLDTIARGLTVQYTAVAKDQSGNVVNTPFNWVSTAQTIATINPSGLATAVAGDSTLVIAGAGGYADTAKLYVRALRTVVVSPADTVVTAVNDSFPLTTSAKDNFGAVMTTGFTTRVFSASPNVVVVNAATGRIKSVGAGNGVLVVRDSVDPLLVVQGSATVHVNQVTFGIANAPKDSIEVGVGGKAQIVGHALDRNGYVIPGKTFGWATRTPTIATVDGSGNVTGVALGQTYAVDSVDGFRDSTRVSVVPTPPPVIQWATDTIAVGNGGNISVALSLTRPPSTGPLIVKLTSSDTAIARPQSKTVTFPAGTAGASVVINGVGAGRVTLTASDSSGQGYQSGSMVVTVVSTIQFQETGTFTQQPNFYVNQNETHRAQVFLSDPAPAGGLGVTFVYGKPGTSTVSPAPAIIPAGQLAADIVISGLAPGTDSVVPTSGGFVGKFSRVYVAANKLTLTRAYPYTGLLGIGQTAQPYVSITYSMDHNLVFSATLSPGIGTVQTPDTIRSGGYNGFFTVVATAPGKTYLTVSAPGWVGVTDSMTFTTPHLQATGSGSLVAGDPNKGTWYAYTNDSAGGNHTVKDTVVVTAVSRNPLAVAVDSATGRVVPGYGSVGVGSALRALPSAGGDSAWIVLTATGYTADSFKVHVTRPTLTFSVGYPYYAHVGIGTLYQNAGYLQIPYVRTDTFTVLFGHTRRGIVSGPDSVRIIKGQTSASFNIVGDSLGTDAIFITRATGYVVTPDTLVYTVGPIHVRPYTYPSVTNYTISAPTVVTAVVVDSANGYAFPLVAPLRVTLTSSKPAEFTLDSGAVTIDSGLTYSYTHPDTLRFRGVDTVGARILSSAPGSTPDSSNVIKVFPTPLQLNRGYPYTVGRGLREPNNSVSLVGGVAPSAVAVTLQRYNRAVDSLSTGTVTIPQGQTTSGSFELLAIDSTGTDSITASAAGYVTTKLTISPEAASLIQGGIPATRLTTDLPYTALVYTGTRSRTILKPFSTVSVTVVSTNPNVVLIDSAGGTISPRGDTAVTLVDTTRTYGGVRVRFVGSGSARLLYSAGPGFATDSTPLVTVTGPTLHLSTGNQNVGVGQLLTGQYVYVDNPVTGTPLVVQLLKSDSLQPAASQAFTLSASSVTIPVNSTGSNTFEIQGNAIGSAVLTARAPAYSQSTGTVSVSQPKLVVSPKNLTLTVGQVPYSVYVYTADQSGATHIVAAPLAVNDTSRASTVVQPDSLVLQVPARLSSTSVGLQGFVKGTAPVIFTAAGYSPDTVVVAVDTGQLSLVNPPNGLGPGQISTNQMYVQLTYTTAAGVVVNLASNNPNVLTVPSTVTIPANNSYAYFAVTGVGVGTANVTATATGVKPAAAVPVRISMPKFVVSLASISNAGQKATITVSAADSLGTTRTLTSPLTVSLASTNPNHAVFDSATVHIPTGSSSVSTGVVFDTAGTYTITAALPTGGGYTPGSATTTTTGALVRMIAPTSFSPASVTIKAGQYVTWRNDDGIAHTTTSNAGVTPAWSSGNLLPGGTYQVYFGTPGTYGYYCAIHGAALMSGTVIVQ